MSPGVKYSAYQLSDLLGVSRTPVRDALLRLEEVGLIQFEARQGFRIVLPHPKEIADIFAVRIALEVPAVRRAASTADPNTVRALEKQLARMHTAVADDDEPGLARHDLSFHDAILGVAGNHSARKIVATLRESTRLLGATTGHRSRTLADIDNEHTPILAAIAANDADAAEAAMREHLEVTGRLLVEQAIKEQQLELDADSIWANAVAD
jgi:DNA-binding GntR family transcriptional regulator